LRPVNPQKPEIDLSSILNQLERSSINRANRTLNPDVTLHRYSSLLAFDRLMHLISLLIQEPGLGTFHQTDSEHLHQLLGGKDFKDVALSYSTHSSVAEVCAVLAHHHGELYADPTAIAQDLDWLEDNGFLHATPAHNQLSFPPTQETEINPHFYSDWEVFQRLMVTTRFITHHPFAWTPEQSSSLKSLVSAMQEKGLIEGDRQASIRKDIEQVLKPFGILPNQRMRRGYFIGSGLLSEQQLLRVASLLQSQVKNIQDPAAHSILETLYERLRRSQHDVANLYPVRAIGNRTIVNVDQLPSSAIARTTEALEEEIESGKMIELKRFKGVGRFEERPDKFFRVWPLQIVFHNIAWYLGYEIAEGDQAGLLQFERMDRVFRGKPQSAQREIAAQQTALARLQKLYQACGSLYLGNSANQQRQFLSRNKETKAAVTLTLELWFTDAIFAFVSEGTQRFPTKQMKLSPRLATMPKKNDPLFCLSKSCDKQHPNRMQVELPIWAVQDIELRRWIIGFGDGVKVVSPPDIAQKIHHMGRAIVDLYEK
jgi:hypothetical protein